MDVSQVTNPAINWNAAAGAAGRAAGAESVSQQGTVGGYQVVVETDISAMIADSMDEVSQLFEEKTAKQIGDRKMGEKRTEERRFDAKVDFWNEKLPDMPNREELMRLLRMMKSNPNMTQSELLKLLQKFSSDVTHQFAALDTLEEMLGDSPEALALLRQTREALEKSDGAAIRAGINLADALKDTGAPPEHLQQLRDLYRSEILGFSTPAECFRSLIARGEGTLGKSLDFLMNACNVDMAAATPSTSQEELRRIMLDLQCVNVLRFAVDKFDSLAMRMLKEFQQPLNLTGETITGRVLDLAELSFLDSAALAKFVSQCGVAALLAKIDFMRESSKIFRSLSERLFRNPESREKLLQGTQDYLDELIAEDEAENQTFEEHV